MSPPRAYVQRVCNSRLGSGSSFSKVGKAAAGWLSGNRQFRRGIFSFDYLLVVLQGIDVQTDIAESRPLLQISCKPVVK